MLLTLNYSQRCDYCTRVYSACLTQVTVTDYVTEYLIEGIPESVFCDFCPRIGVYG